MSILPNTRINASITKVKASLDNASNEISVIHKFYQSHKIHLSEKPKLEELLFLKEELDNMNERLKYYKGVAE